MTRTPPSDSVSRPVTSALILARWRKMGRMMPNAFRNPSPNTIRQESATIVSSAFMDNKIPSTITAVRKPPDVLLHVPAQLRNQARRGFGKQLCQSEGRHALDCRRAQHRKHQRQQPLNLPLADDVVDEIFGRVGQ